MRALQPRSLVIAGIAVHLLATAAALAVGFAQGSPMPLTTALLDRAGPAVAFGLLPPALAAVAWQRQDRTLLGVAAVLLLPAVPSTFGASLLALLTWVGALMRMPHRANLARPVSAALAVGAAAVLAVASVVALSAYRNPACWTYTEDADGARTYEPAPRLVTDQPGFGMSSPGGAGTVEQSVPVDPQTSEPVDGATGHTCVSHHTTGLQTGAALVLALGSVGAAGGLAARRPDPSPNPTTGR